MVLPWLPTDSPRQGRGHGYLRPPTCVRIAFSCICNRSHLLGSGALERQQASSWPTTPSTVRPLKEACMLSAEPLASGSLLSLLTRSGHRRLQQTALGLLAVDKGSRGSSDWKAMELFEGSLPLVGGAEGSRGCEQGFRFPNGMRKAAVVAASDRCNAHSYPKTSQNFPAIASCPILKCYRDQLAQWLQATLGSPQSKSAACCAAGACTTACAGCCNEACMRSVSPWAGSQKDQR